MNKKKMRFQKLFSFNLGIMGSYHANTDYQGWTDHLETRLLPEGPGCPW
ncbi:unnamed protein product [Staurois parvus]|uniref:Uncharacterized protein n=1 Tax=Staurois parvus TaxID=386267 RepID=A0ABN9BZN1_9NEOB|nr:unnamed protein product [Staurois parvus]